MTCRLTVAGRAGAAAGLSKKPVVFAVGRAVGVHHQTVRRCMEQAAVEGPMAALDDRPRPTRHRRLPLKPRAWIKDLACRKAREFSYPHELCTTRLLASNAREHGPAEGHDCLANLAQGTLCKILNEHEIKPHKVRYYLERRDPEFKQEMAEIASTAPDLPPQPGAHASLMTIFSRSAPSHSAWLRSWAALPRPGGRAQPRIKVVGISDF
jgi:hypothetical protein